MLRDHLSGKYAREATVTVTEQVTPAVRRIRLETDRPVEFPYTPGQHIRIQLMDPLSVPGILRPGETLRTYTIWDLDAGRTGIELRVHLYDGDGIGLRWARKAAPGERVTFWWPQGDFFTREAAYHVFVGEETAAAAFGPMLRALDAAAEVHGVLESEAPEHDLPMPDVARRVRRVHRRGAPAAASAVLLGAVAELDLPGNAGAAYVAGEARTCRLVRDYLVRERNWPRTSIKVKPFWTPGKRGLH
ncbi:siderophore-interacting protein [Nonomuraea bangladeshensis]|uniref:siderophore-interacting protein n=1 Tax=Nonomuraea bangladeshensis TaxID=404385 RepID=UPI003C300F59